MTLRDRRLRKEYGDFIAAQDERNIKSALRVFREALYRNGKRQPNDIEREARELEVRLRGHK